MVVIKLIKDFKYHLLSQSLTKDGEVTDSAEDCGRKLGTKFGEKRLDE